MPGLNSEGNILLTIQNFRHVSLRNNLLCRIREMIRNRKKKLRCAFMQRFIILNDFKCLNLFLGMFYL